MSEVVLVAVVLMAVYIASADAIGVNVIGFKSSIEQWRLTSAMVLFLLRE